MAKNIKIKSLVINIAGKDVTLTLKEAKELHKELGEIFNTPITPSPSHYPELPINPFMPVLPITTPKPYDAWKSIKFDPVLPSAPN